jgi:hypothetical protein
VPRPRNLDDPACRRLREHIFHVMGLDHSGQSLDGEDAKVVSIVGRR